MTVLDWNKAPEDATHIAVHDLGKTWFRLDEFGTPYVYHMTIHCWQEGFRYGAPKKLIPRPQKPAAPEWDGEGLPPVGCKCIAQDSEFCKEVLVLAYADSHGEEKSVMLTEILEDGRHGRLHAFIARLINFSPLRTKEQRERDELAQIIKDKRFTFKIGPFGIVEDSRAEDLAANIIAAGWRKGDL